MQVLNTYVGVENLSPQLVVFSGSIHHLSPNSDVRDFPHQSQWKILSPISVFLVFIALMILCVCKSLWRCVCGCWGKVIYNKSDVTLGALGTDCHNWWSQLVWVTPWILTKKALLHTVAGKIAGAPAWNQDWCAQWPNFHWQKQYLLNCPFIELSLTLFLMRRPSLKGVTKAPTYLCSFSTFPSTFSIPQLKCLHLSLCMFLITYALFFSPYAQFRDPGHNSFNWHRKLRCIFSFSF